MDGLRAGKKTGGEKLRRCGGSGTDGSGGGGGKVCEGRVLLNGGWRECREGDYKR